MVIAVKIKFPTLSGHYDFSKLATYPGRFVWSRELHKTQN